MFVLTKKNVKHKIRIQGGNQGNDPDILLNELQNKVKERIDYKKTDPIASISAAVKPILFTFTAVFMVTAISSRHPDLDIYAGKILPAQIVKIGAVLTKEDRMIMTKNHTLTFPAEGETTLMIVWDYAAEDGDMVSVLFDGKPVGDSFSIVHAPKTIKVPKGSSVEVIGTHDGGGGITYAVSFPEIQKTILNGLDSGEKNIYTLNVQGIQ